MSRCARVCVWVGTCMYVSGGMGQRGQESIGAAFLDVSTQYAGMTKVFVECACLYERREQMKNVHDNDQPEGSDGCSSEGR